MTALVRSCEGGSLNETTYSRDGRYVVKSYHGPIPRGHVKLRDEYEFLTALPEHAARHFARVAYFLDQAAPRRTLLKLYRVGFPSVAKAVLSAYLTPARTGHVVSTAMGTLLDDVYPVASETRDGSDVYTTYHESRLAVLPELAALPDLAPLYGARTVIVNGRNCPSPTTIAAWLPDIAARAFQGSCRLVHAHLDPQLDNILATYSGRLETLFVDPRGQRLGPAHYDFSKALKSVRSHYHEIHYDRYSLDVRDLSGDGVAVTLTVNRTYADCFRAAQDALIDTARRFAAAEGVSISHFVRRSLVAELVHVLSFSYYHAYRPRGRDSHRVLAFLAVACLLAARLQDGMTDLDSLTHPLLP